MSEETKTTTIEAQAPTSTKRKQAKDRLNPNNIDPERETLADFRDKIAIAEMDGEDWVETTLEVISAINKKGLGVKSDGKPIEFFIYQGKKVCEYGKKDKIQAEEKEQIRHKMFGDKEGTIVGR